MLQMMFVTSSPFAALLNTAVTSKKKNRLKRQRKTLKLEKKIKKAQKNT